MPRLTQRRSASQARQQVCALAPCVPCALRALCLVNRCVRGTGARCIAPAACAAQLRLHTPGCPCRRRTGAGVLGLQRACTGMYEQQCGVPPGDDGQSSSRVERRASTWCGGGGGVLFISFLSFVCFLVIQRNASGGLASSVESLKAMEAWAAFPGLPFALLHCARWLVDANNVKEGGQGREEVRSAPCARGPAQRPPPPRASPPCTPRPSQHTTVRLTTTRAGPCLLLHHHLRQRCALRLRGCHSRSTDRLRQRGGAALCCSAARAHPVRQHAGHGSQVRAARVRARVHHVGCSVQARSPHMLCCTVQVRRAAGSGVHGRWLAGRAVHRHGGL